jgi:tetraacyldisaccharide-1-P 4'-kinase
MLAHALPGVPVWRARTGRAGLAALVGRRCRSDDGFQHPQLRAWTRCWSVHRPDDDVPPTGRLREPLGAAVAAQR